MNLEKYYISVKPEQVLSKLIEERKREAYRNIFLAERIIKEKLAERVNDMNLESWIGNSVKSTEELIEFMKLLKERGMSETDLKMIRDLLFNAKELLGVKEKV
jgi:phosphotransacetylase